MMGCGHSALQLRSIRCWTLDGMGKNVASWGVRKRAHQMQLILVCREHGAAPEPQRLTIASVCVLGLKAYASMLGCGLSIHLAKALEKH